AVTLRVLFRRRFAVPFLQRGLVVEQFKVAWRARHEKVNDALGLCGEMRLPGRERIQRCVGSPAVLAEQGAQRDRAEADAALLEEPAARDEFRVQAAIEV